MVSPKFKFKIIPIDIHSIYLFDEEINEYVEIPNADPEFGHISLEEYNFLRKVLRQNGYTPDTQAIMNAREHLQDLIGGSLLEKKRILREHKMSTARQKALQKPTQSMLLPHDHQEKTPTVHKQKTSESWTPKDFDIEIPE